MYHNVERSGFRSGEYVGHSRFGVYRVRRIGRESWSAYALHRNDGAPWHYRARTLREVSGWLDSL